MTHLRSLIDLVRRLEVWIFPRGLIRTIRPIVQIGIFGFFVASCTSTKPHNGRVPFTWTEAAPRSNAPDRLEAVLSYDHEQAEDFEEKTAQLRPGDVLGFVMSHRQAAGLLLKGNIKKLPYELFRYGHVSIVVPSPQKPERTDDLRLLQVSILQPVTADDTLEELRLQSWDVYRPPTGSIDSFRLAEFTSVVTERADDWKAYDFVGITGFRNSDAYPLTPDEIEDQYSCATLVVAALNYSGFELDAIHRRGWLDLVSPRQVLESRGSARPKEADPSH